MALAVDPNDRSFAPWGISSAAHVVATQTPLIAPMHLSPFGLRSGGDVRVVLIQPFLHRGGRLFVGPLQRLLRSEAPACQVQPHRTDRQADAETPFDELGYGRA